MPSILSADEIIEIAGGRLAQGMVPGEPGPVCTDTRKHVEGAWFVALKGRKYDGHDFLGDAFSGGALGSIVEERHSYPLPGNSFPLIAVPDTLLALRDLGRNWRRRLAVKVIFVIGAERTRSLALSTYMFKLLSTRFMANLVDASVAPDLALTELVQLNEETRFLVVNMVPPAFEDIDLLSKAFCPNVVVFVDEPFGYMRLSARKDELKQAALTVVSHMDRRPGLVLACGEAAQLMAGIKVSEPHVLRIYDGPSTSPQAPSSASADCFMPSIEESCCVAEVCKHFGIPDDIIYGAFL